MRYSKVKVWEESVVIPTYKIGNPDKNPMFLEKRVYQGSSGKVYPHTVIDKIYDEKYDREYKAVFLENDFVKIMVLPEIGGRIQRATDKTNGYDFVYYNHVIKPALVGLAGPWISGGIEFNWPQHHRPSTFDKVDYTYRENSDGSATITVGEIENMFRTKGIVNFTLYPDSTYIEIKAQLYNRTDVPQTFLWWANPAVAVNDNTRTIMPPDVTAVMDHGKRDVSEFPIATGTYYKVDYSKGVDISRYKNLPVPTSYMAAKSDYDFVGGYDDGIEAGILHVADHHISPGKKQWTWGCGDFGKAWDRNLTDEDGPYVELMTGCFTDNQPDFSWIAPMEERRFTQYFMPYKKLGTVHNATKDLAIHIENGKAALYATGNVGEITIKLISDDKTEEHTAVMNPTDYIEFDIADSKNAEIEVYKNNRKYLSYNTNCKKQPIPEAAKPAPASEECKTNEDLYLYGLHIEQYRHATYNPEDYYLEGLKRDEYDIRINNAYGLRLMKRGLFSQAQTHFEKAVSRLTRSNPNPYDSEAYYNLGLSLLYQGKDSEAYDAFYKSAWSNNCQESAFYKMACICAKNREYNLALEHVENGIIKNGRNYKALNLKVWLLDKIGDTEKAKICAENILQYEPLDYMAKNYLGLSFDMNDNTAIEIAIEYASFGDYKSAVNVLENQKSTYPLVHYYLAFYDRENSAKHLEAARALPADGCFPHRLEDMQCLSYAVSVDGNNAMDNYYLGNLYYDYRRYDDAIECFKTCTDKKNEFPTAHRNLALLYYNKKNDIDSALSEMELAFAFDESDMRVLLELDLLYKNTGKSNEERIAFLEKYLEKLSFRDDLYLEYITLLNLTGRYDEAYERIMNHNFHPWEGGEGKVPAQYIAGLVLKAKENMDKSNYEIAEELLKKTFEYPHNLGEGKLYGAQENLQNYLLGVVCENLHKNEEARIYFEKASSGLNEPKSAMYYNDQPPETVFCQGLAHIKLNNKEQAELCFNNLISYCYVHINDDVKIDYFAVSLPDFLVLDADLNKQNKAHCLFMKGLGVLGLEKKSEAKEIFDKVNDMNPSHFALKLYCNLFLKG